MTRRFSMCNFCDSACGLEVEVEARRVIAVRGDRENAFTRGHVCPKGLAQQDLYNDPDRLRRPVRKKGDDWEEVSWDEALDEAGRQLAETQKRHGPDAVGVYWGNPAAHDYRALLSILPFTKAFKTKNIYSANSVDALTRMLVSYWVFGNQAVLPVPDLERTRHLLIIGANPVISHGSIMTAPDTKKRLTELRERGGKIVVIDPRRTETAALADRHHFIAPGTDALLLMAMLNALFAEDLVRVQGLESKLKGLDSLRQAAADFAPEAVADTVGIGAADIRQVVREFCAAPSSMCYGRMGISTQAFGATCTWLIDVFNVLAGRMGEVGGAMFARPAVDLLWLSKILRQPGFFGRYRSRVSGLPEFNGELPVAALAEEIETPGPGQIKALVTLAGNPVLSLPNGRQLDRAFASLDFMVSIDYYVNETTRHADLILPPITPLESDHYPILEMAMGVRDFAHYSEPAVPAESGAKANWEIMTELVYNLEKHRGPLDAALGALKRKALYLAHPRRQLQLLLKLGPRKLSLDELKQHPHGLDLGPLQPGFVQMICHRDGRLDLAPAPLMRDVERVKARLAEKPDPDRLLLVSRRTMRSMNSWLANQERLVAGKDRCTLRMHPADAARRGLADGQRVKVSSRVGEIMVPVEVSDEMMPGVVSMAFGWGHDRPGARLSVARERAGVSMNDIVDEKLFDPVSGISVLDGLPVRVEGE